MNRQCFVQRLGPAPTPAVSTSVTFDPKATSDVWPRVECIAPNSRELQNCDLCGEFAGTYQQLVEQKCVVCRIVLHLSHIQPRPSWQLAAFRGRKTVKIVCALPLARFTLCDGEYNLSNSTANVA